MSLQWAVHAAVRKRLVESRKPPGNCHNVCRSSTEHAAGAAQAWSSWAATPAIRWWWRFLKWWWPPARSATPRSSGGPCTRELSRIWLQAATPSCSKTLQVDATFLLHASYWQGATGLAPGRIRLKHGGQVGEAAVGLGAGSAQSKLLLCCGRAPTGSLRVATYGAALIPSLEADMGTQVAPAPR